MGNTFEDWLASGDEDWLASVSEVYIGIISDAAETDEAIGASCLNYGGKMDIERQVNSQCQQDVAEHIEKLLEDAKKRPRPRRRS